MKVILCKHFNANTNIKVIFIILLLLINYSNVIAQPHSVGGKIGFGISSFHGKDIAEFDSRFAYFISVYSVIKLSKKVFIQPEINIDHNGAEHYYNGNDEIIVEQTTTLKYTYLSLPVLLKLQFGKRVKYNFNLGPYFAFMLSGKERVKGWTKQDSEIVEFDGEVNLLNRPGTNKIEYGAITGFEIIIPVNNSIHVNIEPRYNIAFSSVFKKDHAENFPKNHSLILNAGIIYVLKR